MVATERTQLIRLLEALDVPECDCVPPDCGHTEPCDCVPPPCEHVLGADHGLPIEAWVQLLHAAWPEPYAEPPPPRVHALVLTREARVAVLESRHAAGYGLWHAGDLMPEDVEQLGRTIRLTRGNNRPVDAGLTILGGRSCA